MANGCQDPDFVNCILNVLGWHGDELNFFEGIDMVVLDPFNFVYAGKCAVSQLRKHFKIAKRSHAVVFNYFYCKYHIIVQTPAQS